MHVSCLQTEHKGANIHIMKPLQQMRRKRANVQEQDPTPLWMLPEITTQLPKSTCEIKHKQLQFYYVRICNITMHVMISYCLWLQASAPMLIRSMSFRDITQHRVVILYRRFWTMCRSHLHGSLSLGLSWPRKTRNVGKGLPCDAVSYPRTQMSSYCF
jgi:hypothetical protein